jgi:hypothetical protein
MDYWLKPVKEPGFIINYFEEQVTYSSKLILVALLAAITSLLQSAGGFFPGIGYMISPLATLPMILAMLVSRKLGFWSYIITIVLLLIIQPSEIHVFCFTTGLLGMGLGFSFHFVKRRIGLAVSGAVSLLIGISFLLYGIDFAILGPVSTSWSFARFIGIFIFCFIYSWFWVTISLSMCRRLGRFSGGWFFH